MYQLSFYVPQEDLEQVKTALFAKGAGKYRNYDCCCWQVLGQGQFRPLSGSNPHIGQVGDVEMVTEYKVEMLVDDALIREVVAELIHVHPYEEPAYAIVRMEDDTH